MSDWKAKRFWTEASVTDQADGFGVALDGRPVKTPSKAALIVPTRALAEAMAAEWDAQDKEIDPATMPVTRAANSAIDKVAVQFDEVAQMIADYGDSDLLCYRADSPDELTKRQSEAWDPLLGWCRDTFDAPLTPVTGIMHRPQAAASLDKLRAAVFDFSAFELTALHDLVALSGSLVIGLAATRNQSDALYLWEISRIDEQWQIEQWGEDEEASEVAERKRQEFLSAKQFFDMSKAV